MRWVRCTTLVIMVVLLATSGPAAAQEPPAPARQSLTLREAIVLAAQQNPQLRVVAFDAQIARAQLAQAKAATAGQLSAQASYSQTQEQPPTIVLVGGVPATIPPPSATQYDVRLVFQYPLSTGGRIEAQVAMAEANAKGAEAALQRQIQQVELDVSQAYFRVLLTQAGLEVADRAIQQATETLRVARVRIAAGAASQFDEIQAQVALANAQLQQVRARNAIALATQGLNALLGLPLDTSLGLEDGFVPGRVEVPLDRLVATAQINRPEIGELQAAQAAAQFAIALAESGQKPTVSLNATGSYGTTGQYTTSALTNWSVMLGATLSLFDGGDTSERVHEARLRLEQLKSTEVQTRQKIDLEVRQAYLNLEAAYEELATADALVAQANEAQRIAVVRFQSGAVTNLEVITAQATASQAEGARAQALFDYSFSRASLERAVGAEVR